MIDSSVIYLTTISLLVLLLIRCWRSRQGYKKIAEDAVRELCDTTAKLLPLHIHVAEEKRKMEAERNANGTGDGGTGVDSNR